MAGVVGVHHTSFTVADLDLSVAFFRDRLGLELLFVREVRDDYLGRIVGLPGTMVRAALLRLPGSAHHVELFQYLHPPGQAHSPRPCDPGSTHLALLVDDLPALYGQLAAQGVAFVSAPVPITAGPNRGAQAVYLRDPNGILVELLQPPPQRPA
jgi:catechol 2,3-dioxygenase-like lactoylglutathione lyase family enzyme